MAMNTIPCRFEKAPLGCRNGSACPFKHETTNGSSTAPIDVVRSKPRSVPTSPVRIVQEVPRQQPCKFFAENKCSKGSECRFAHTITAAKVVTAPLTIATRTNAAAGKPASPTGSMTESGDNDDGSTRVESPRSNTSGRVSPRESALTKALMESKPVDAVAQTTPPDDSEIVYCSESTPAGEAPKTVLKDFEILHQIGDGLVGSVFLVRFNRNKQLYAMKVIPKELVLAENMLAYIKAERDIMGQVKHPFIVALHFAFQTAAKLILIMDYLPGGDLAFHLRRKCTLSEEEVRFYAAEVYLAISHLHEHRVVHRDVKLPNVLLDMEGHVRVTDFGMSKQMDAKQASNPRGLSTYCGTLAYMAPEIIKAEGHGMAADWWSFGITIFEMLTGARPFDDTTDEKVSGKIVGAPIRLPKALSPEVKSLLAGLLQRDPSKRITGEAIRAHAFFAPMDFTALLKRQITPPFQPYMAPGEGDAYVGNFPSSLTDATPPNLSFVFATPDRPGAAFNFESFTYQDPSLFGRSPLFENRRESRGNARRLMMSPVPGENDLSATNTTMTTDEATPEDGCFEMEN